MGCRNILLFELRNMNKCTYKLMCLEIKQLFTSRGLRYSALDPDGGAVSSIRQRPVPGPVAGFMGVDVIRMPLKNIPTLILLFNFYIYIILLLEIDNSIIIGLKIMNLNILLLNF